MSWIGLGNRFTPGMQVESPPAAMDSYPGRNRAGRPPISFLRGAACGGSMPITRTPARRRGITTTPERLPPAFVATKQGAVVRWCSSMEAGMTSKRTTKVTNALFVSARSLVDLRKFRART